MALRSDAQRNVERLEAAALEVFQETGLGSPLEEIARRAGVSVGTLYNRFGSREALIDAVVPALAAAKLAPVIEAAHAGTDPWDRFARYLRALGEAQIDDPALSDAITRAYPDTSHELPAACASAFAEGARLIDAAQHDGALRPDLAAGDLTALLTANAAVIRAEGAHASRRLITFVLEGVRA